MNPESNLNNINENLITNSIDDNNKQELNKEFNNLENETTSSESPIKSKENDTISEISQSAIENTDLASSEEYLSDNESEITSENTLENFENKDNLILNNACDISENGEKIKDLTDKTVVSSKNINLNDNIEIKSEIINQSNSQSNFKSLKISPPPSEWTADSEIITLAPSQAESPSSKITLNSSFRNGSPSRYSTSSRSSSPSERYVDLPLRLQRNISQNRIKYIIMESAHSYKSQMISDIHIVGDPKSTYEDKIEATERIVFLDNKKMTENGGEQRNDENLLFNPTAFMRDTVDKNKSTPSKFFDFFVQTSSIESPKERVEREKAERNKNLLKSPKRPHSPISTVNLYKNVSPRYMDNIFSPKNDVSQDKQKIIKNNTPKRNSSTPTQTSVSKKITKSSSNTPISPTKSSSKTNSKTPSKSSFKSPSKSSSKTPSKTLTKKSPSSTPISISPARSIGKQKSLLKEFASGNQDSESTNIQFNSQITSPRIKITIKESISPKRSTSTKKSSPSRKIHSSSSHSIQSFVKQAKSPAKTKLNNNVESPVKRLQRDISSPLKKVKSTVKSNHISPIKKIKKSIETVDKVSDKVTKKTKKLKIFSNDDNDETISISDSIDENYNIDKNSQESRSSPWDDSVRSIRRRMEYIQDTFNTESLPPLKSPSPAKERPSFNHSSSRDLFDLKS